MVLNLNAAISFRKPFSSSRGSFHASWTQLCSFCIASVNHTIHQR